MEKILLKKCNSCDGEKSFFFGISEDLCKDCNGFGKSWNHDFLKRFQYWSDSRVLRYDTNFEIIFNSKSLPISREKLEKNLYEIDKILQSNPSDASSWKNKILILGYLGKDNYIHLSSDKYIKLKPKDVFGWYTKACSLSSVGWKYEAIEFFDKALEIEPDNALIWYNKGVTLFNEENTLEEFNAILKCLDKATELTQDDFEFWNTKGYILAMLQRYDESIGCLEKSNELDPENTLSLNLMANIFAERGNYAKALEYFDKSSKIKPKDANLEWDNGLTFVALKKFGDALKCFDRALEAPNELMNRSWQVKDHKADVLQLLGYFEEYQKLQDEIMEDFNRFRDI